LVGSDRIEFARYSSPEIESILEQRALRGLAREAIGQREIKQIAEASAGDARAAISILRSAARTAQRTGDDRITEAIVSESIPDARQEIHQKNLDRLTPDQRAVYDIIAEAGTIDPSTLYTQYRDTVSNPKTDRTVRNYLSKMVQYDLLIASGTSRDRVYKIK